MPLLPSLTLILGLQVLGEVISRLLHLPLPGPVVGMALLLALLLAWPGLLARIRSTALGLIAHLSLLFVPAGVGVIGHLPALGQSLWPLLAVLIASTLLTLIASVLTFHWVARWTGGVEPRP